MGEATRRWIRRALWILVPGAALYYLVLGGEYGVFDVRELERSRARAVDRVDSLQATVDSLAARAEALARDTLAIERLARERYGFIRDGERLYRFVPAEASGTEPKEGSGVDPSGGRR